MASERLILCGGAEESPPRDPEPIRLWLDGPNRNVHRRIEDVLSNMFTKVPNALLDLIDIATYVYAADQAITRGGVDDCMESWRRNLIFKLPVRDPDLWLNEPVYSQLVNTLSFLSEDEYRFEFVPLREESWQNLEMGGTVFDGIVDDVMLFSGGLDSLAGAIKESITDKRKVLLVNHRSTEKVSPRHNELLRLLRDHAGRSAPLQVRVRVNKDKALGKAFTQRPRSFLFASLGATFATMIGHERLRFYENGVVSLNLPLSAQVLGARASRTTHPRILAGFGRLISLLVGKPFVVENPFLWETKTDIVRRIASAGCGDLIRHSTSCGRTWTRTHEHTHCGDCSQCIDRRFAVLAAKQAEQDPGACYAIDLLTGARPDPQSRVLLAAYLETANRADQLTDLQFFSRYGGEVSRALSALGLGHEEAARRVLKLYRSHAHEVNGVIDAAIGEFGTAIRKRDLPESCLIRMVLGDPDEDDPAPREDLLSSVPPNAFQWRGTAWVVRFAGGEVNILFASKGASYLHHLLSKPGTSPSALDLAVQVARVPHRHAPGSAGTIADRDALTAYRARLVEVAADLETAQRNNDPGAAERAREEQAELVAEIQAVEGIGGQLRKASDDREKVRKAVGIAIRRTIQDIAVFDKALADHLGRHILCGRHPCYSFGPSVRWET